MIQDVIWLHVKLPQNSQNQLFVTIEEVSTLNKNVDYAVNKDLNKMILDATNLLANNLKNQPYKLQLDVITEELSTTKTNAKFVVMNSI